MLVSIDVSLSSSGSSYIWSMCEENDSAVAPVTQNYVIPCFKCRVTFASITPALKTVITSN